MGQNETKLTGPDFAEGIPFESLDDGQMLVGHAHGKAVLLVRTTVDVYAISPSCTHYNGPLAEGLIVGETIRCPWHHACFDLRTGEAIRAPARVLGGDSARWVDQSREEVRTARAQNSY